MKEKYSSHHYPHSSQNPKNSLYSLSFSTNVSINTPLFLLFVKIEIKRMSKITWFLDISLSRHCLVFPMLVRILWRIQTRGSIEQQISKQNGNSKILLNKRMRIKVSVIASAWDSASKHQTQPGFVFALPISLHHSFLQYQRYRPKNSRQPVHRSLVLSKSLT